MQVRFFFFRGGEGALKAKSKNVFCNIIGSGFRNGVFMTCAVMLAGGSCMIMKFIK